MRNIIFNVTSEEVKKFSDEQLFNMRNYLRSELQSSSNDSQVTSAYLIIEDELNRRSNIIKGIGNNK